MAGYRPRRPATRGGLGGRGLRGGLRAAAAGGGAGGAAPGGAFLRIEPISSGPSSASILGVAQPVAQFVADEHLESLGAFGRRLARADVVAHREAALHLDVRPPRQRPRRPFVEGELGAAALVVVVLVVVANLVQQQLEARVERRPASRLSASTAHATSSFAPQKARAWTTPRSRTDAYGAAASAAAAAGLAAGSAKSCTRCGARSTARSSAAVVATAPKGPPSASAPTLASDAPIAATCGAASARNCSRCGAPPWSCI